METHVHVYSNSYVGYVPFDLRETQRFLNQTRASLWPARAWFLRIATVSECLYDCVCVCVCVCACVRACVCPPPNLLINNGMMWCDIDPI